MIINFNIDYKTFYGEEVLLNIIGADGRPVARTMSTLDGRRWFCQLNIDAKARPAVIDYFYSTDYGTTQRRREWKFVGHRLDLSAAKGMTYTVYDRWHDIPDDSCLYSSAFTDCIYHHRGGPMSRTEYGRTVRLVVRAPQLRDGERLAILGADDALGHWDSLRAIDMTQHNINEWAVDLNADAFPERHIEFKFVVLDAVKDVTPLWEEGQNRTVDFPEIQEGSVVVYGLEQASFPIYGRKLAGTLVPVFSLRTRGSFGVGDFGDLKTMIDYVAQTHQHVLQILPVNDTTTTHTWTDSYPYSCISVFALHPQYADLRQLPPLTDEGRRSHYADLQADLNTLPQVDYERVIKAKMAYLRELYEQEWHHMVSTKAYRDFFNRAASWLVPYAQYCTLRDKYGTADFSQWPDHKQWDEADRKSLANSRTKAYKEVEFWYFVQFVLNRQLESAHDYARSRHVILKGDIPIGVSRYGCDVWMEPRYFNLDGQAGAPPDDFAIDGQNWGFPTYNWEAMLADGCRWWVSRFQNMAHFFDAYRIDHVLGFFRIWEIPVNAVSGLLGQFSPALGLTRQEIEAYGLRFQEKQFLQPFISDWVLDRVFHDRAQEVRDKYLDHAHDDIWHMKPAYDTQQKVVQAFAGVADRQELDLRDGLLTLIADVLFVRDRNDAGKFHPRICAQHDFTYEALVGSDKDAFNRLYDDYFYRRNNQFWYREAMKKLPRLVEATRMLVCAEDLGMVPGCVPWVMDELKILSLEIQSMPKDPRVRFGHLSRNPYLSVCTISTHDMSTLRQWWDESLERTQDYYSSMLHRSGAAPHPLPGWLAGDIVSRHLTSPSMLCILSIQDWMAINERLRLPDAAAERINIPANPHHYWRYRMHVNIEDLMKNHEFCQQVTDLVEESVR